MVDVKFEKPQVSAAQLKPVMLPLAALCGVLALWMGWAGVQQHLDSSRRTDLTRERDAAVASAHDALGVEHKRLRDRLGGPALQAALQSGDFKAAGAELTKDWPGASAGTVLAPDLSLDYE
ncbi:MAG: hypothetical protein ACREP7_06775, partial [Lysobacter sp.]